MKNDLLEYKGYRARVVYDNETKSLWGEVVGITDYIDFQSDSLKTIEKEFRKAVDEYLTFCEEVGKEPEKEYKGSFNIRIGTDLHKQIALQSLKEGKSINEYVKEIFTENKITIEKIFEKSKIKIDGFNGLYTYLSSNQNI